MSSEIYRIRIKHGNIELEVESSSQEYVDERIKEHKKSLLPSKEIFGESLKKNLSVGDGINRPTSLKEFFKKIKTENKTEIATVIGYYLEHFAEDLRPQWKPNDIVKLFSEVRAEPPGNPSNIINLSDHFMRDSAKGFYKLTGTGVNWVEEQLKEFHQKG